MEERETYLVRVWLPDRPGALGAVASRLGALKGDVTGLEIVERGGGQAIDELVVSLPSNVDTDLVVREISAEEDVEVEEIVALDGSPYDPQLEALEAAAIVLGAESREELAEALVLHVCRAVRTSWACVLERPSVEAASNGRPSTVVAGWGDYPNDRWLDSFVSGSPAVNNDGPGLELDTVWIPLPAASSALVVGRDGVLRARERQRLAALARIADAWFRRLKEQSDRQAMMLHPSGR